MLKISEEISRNFTPCFSSRIPELAGKTRLSPKELLDIGDEISRDFAPRASTDTPALTLLPVDPGHIHVYWNLGKNQPDNGCKEQLTLRIYPQPDGAHASGNTSPWHDLSLDSPTTSQKLPLPCLFNETAFSAAIGRTGADEGFIALAHSNIIQAHHKPTTYRQAQDTPADCPGKTASGIGTCKLA